MRILIIGAGIGGLCLAQALKKQGIQFTIWERNPDADSWLQGYRINVNPIGSRALFQCLPEHLWEAFLAATADKKDGIAFLTEKMELLVKAENAMMTGGSTKAHQSQYAISRIFLREILMNGMKDSIVFGNTFDHFEQNTGGGVRVYAENGAIFNADLVIGADGANSKVRKQLLPHAQRIETDAVAIAGRTMLTEANRAAIPSLLQERMNVVMPLDKYFLFSSPFDRFKKMSNSRNAIARAAEKASMDAAMFLNDDQNYVLWSFIAHKKEFENQNVTDLQRLILEKTKSWNEGFHRLISLADPGSLNMISLKTMLPIKPWTTGAVTLLGDAIHNMTPLQGMGANMALHDAAVLEKRICNSVKWGKDLLTQITEYEKIMMLRGFSAVNQALKLTYTAIEENKTGRKMSRMWFKLAHRHKFIRKLTFLEKWWEIE
jgi:2-polyprenyl-6-methoxyphenol hydroxylase-like FAD-dependent oxidoreductase